MATVTRLFDTHTQALEAVSALEAAGFDHHKISLISNNADNWHEGHRHADDRKLGDLNGDGENDIAEAPARALRPAAFWARAPECSLASACWRSPDLAPL